MICLRKSDADLCRLQFGLSNAQSVARTRRPQKPERIAAGKNEPTDSPKCWLKNAQQDSRTPGTPDSGGAIDKLTQFCISRSG